MNSPRERDESGATCLLLDFCDRWRAANGLVDADYKDGVPPGRCPLAAGRERRQTDAQASEAGHKLRYCYAKDERGYQLIYAEAGELSKLWRIGDD